MFNATYHVVEDFNIPFDEKGATVGTVRKVQWLKEDEEPDPDKAKIEIRKMYINSEGERTGKGYTFSTPEGPHELTEGLVNAGFGNTKEILKAVRKRDDFLDSAKNINEDDDQGDGEVFDMRDLLIGSEDEEEE